MTEPEKVPVLATPPPRKTVRLSLKDADAAARAGGTVQDLDYMLGRMAEVRSDSPKLMITMDQAEQWMSAHGTADLDERFIVAPRAGTILVDSTDPVALGGITQHVAAHIAHTGEGADGAPTRPLHDLLDRDLLARVERFTQPQHCYGDPHKAAQTIRDLAEQLRRQAR